MAWRWGPAGSGKDLIRFLRVRRRRKSVKALALLALGMLCSPSLHAGPVQNEDRALRRIKEAIENTTAEGKEIIERVKRMLPEVNGQVSAQPLEQLIEVFAKEKGERNLTPIGWTAAIVGRFCFIIRTSGRVLILCLLSRHRSRESHQ
jgi:hypothetical protein